MVAEALYGPLAIRSDTPASGSPPEECTLPERIPELLNSTFRTVELEPAAKLPAAGGAATLAPRLTREFRVNPAAGMPMLGVPEKRLEEKRNMPLASVVVWYPLAKIGRSLTMSTGVPAGAGVRPSLASTWPVISPVRGGSAASGLLPSAGMAKLAIAASSASLSPESASGGSWTSRSAAASAPSRPIPCTAKCSRARVSPGATVSGCQPTCRVARLPAAGLNCAEAGARAPLPPQTSATAGGSAWLPSSTTAK